MKESMPIMANEFNTIFALELFQSWFVNFDFSLINNNSKLQIFTGEGESDFLDKNLVESELGLIPEGWQIGRLGDFIQCVGGSTPSTSKPDLWGGEIPWITPKDISSNDSLVVVSTSKSISQEGVKKISSGLLPIDTVIFSCRAPIGYCAITKIQLTINQGFIAFKPNNYFEKEFILNWCLSNRKLIESYASGSTFPEISKSSLRRIKVVIPPKKLIEEYNRIVRPIYQKIAIDREIKKIIRNHRND